MLYLLWIGSQLSGSKRAIYSPLSMKLNELRSFFRKPPESPAPDPKPRKESNGGFANITITQNFPSKDLKFDPSPRAMKCDECHINLSWTEALAISFESKSGRRVAIPGCYCSGCADKVESRWKKEVEA
jgi:hypothetical protein